MGCPVLFWNRLPFFFFFLIAYHHLPPQLRLCIPPNLIAPNRPRSYFLNCISPITKIYYLKIHISNSFFRSGIIIPITPSIFYPDLFNPNHCFVLFYNQLKHILLYILILSSVTTPSPFLHIPSHVDVKFKPRKQTSWIPIFNIFEIIRNSASKSGDHMWWKHSKDQNRKRVLWNGIRLLLIDNFKGATTCKYDIWPGFKSPILEYMGEILYNKGCQMIELFILFLVPG